MDPLRIQEADSNLQAEKKILAAVISELPEGVLICNAEGRMLLFNRRAREFLSEQDPDGGAFNWPPPVPGRSITKIIEKSLIENALEDINERLHRKVLDAVSHFTMLSKKNHILGCRVIPILDHLGCFSGFILILNDITADRESDNRLGDLLQGLTKSARSPLASIRAAIEAMREYPDMDPDQSLQFKEIIYKETLVLSDILNKAAGDFPGLLGAKRSLTPMSGSDLLATLKKRARDRLGIVLQVEPSQAGVWVKVDYYSFFNAVLFLLRQLKSHISLWEFECRLSKDKTFAALDLRWAGAPVQANDLRGWQDQYMVIGQEKGPLTLKEVLDHHQAAVWTSADPAVEDGSYIRLILPAQEPIEPESVRPITILPSHQADFFSPAPGGRTGHDIELDSRLLTELNYTTLIREISELDQIDAIVRKPGQLPALIHQMIKSGATVRNITRLITTFNDAVLKKLIAMAVEASGPPPVPFAFIVLGSEGRKEQTLKTDQDNAIIFQDIAPGSRFSAAEAAGYFSRLSEKVCSWLDQAGYAFCTGEIMAQNPKWCQPLSLWKNYFAQWIHAAEPEDLLQASIFFDFRFAYGHSELVDALAAYLSATIGRWTGFLRHMAANAVYFRPPISFFGNFVVETKGPHRNCLDIKKAITQVVDFARIYALKHNIGETNTQERLYRLCLKDILSREEYNEIDQAYDFMMQIRFAQQIQAMIDENRKPDNYINPKHLSTIEQKMLKEIFKKIERLQGRLNFEFAGTQDTQQA